MNKFDIELVGKIGSMALINSEKTDIDYNVIARLSRELHPGMIWVTSGATEIGRLDYIYRNGSELVGSDEDTKTDYSAQGQAILMQNYRQFIDSKYSTRQILVEHTHFNDEIKREHLRKMLVRCPSQNAIPIINYNDPVSYEENVKMEIQALMKEKKCANLVQCLDNDETASQVACLVKTRTLLILTSVDGIYIDVNDKDSLIKEISGKDAAEVLENVESHQKFCIGSSRKGANGAKAKLEYIKAPLQNGTQVFIANSRYKMKDILEGKAPSTRIGIR